MVSQGALTLYPEEIMPMATPKEIVDTYIATWNARDREQRIRLAEQVLTDDAVVMGPPAELIGRAEIVEFIGLFQQGYPVSRLELTRPLEHHHGWFHTSWRLVDPDGVVRMEGEDTGQVTEDGYVSRVISFPGPPRPRP